MRYKMVENAVFRGLSRGNVKNKNVVENYVEIMYNGRQ